MSRLKSVKRSAVYYFASSLIFLVNLIPRALAVSVGAWFGLLLYAVLPRDRFKFHRHLSMVFGDSLSRREKTTIARNFFVNSGKNLIEVARFKKHFHSQIQPLVEVEGLEHFDRAYRAGKGLIGVTGHIGNFELMAAHIASLGYDTAVIGREMYDKRLDRILITNRESVGLTNIATTDSPRRMLEWLKKGGVVGVLIDTDSFRVRSMFIPFFGRLSNTPVGQTAIGLRTGAAFVPAACVRIPGNRYKVIIKPAVDYTPTGDSDRDIYEITRLCNEALEKIILDYPDQWIWLHNRWHTKPEESA